MKSATPDKTTKAVRRPRCKQCQKQFRTTSPVKVFCTPACQQQATKLKRKVSYTAKASDSAFMDLLARECIRAGTLQVLQGHDVASLTDLYALYKRHLYANEYGASRKFALSHIAPAQGRNSVGLLHPSNLVLAPSDWNRSHGTQHFGHGLSIPRSQLQSRHDVRKGDSRKETITRIIRYLGEDVVSEFSKTVGLQPTQRHKTLAWLLAHLDPTNAEHADYLGKLDAMSGKALTTLKATLLGKEPSGYKPPTLEETLLDVFAQELTRVAAIRPDLAPLATFVAECSKRLDHREPLIWNCPLLPSLFALLHGKELSAVADELTPALHQLRVLGKITLPVPVLAVPSLAQPQPAPKPAVIVHKLFRSFADELDGQIDDKPIPVLQAHTVTYEADPLPWG
ncbi:hypothetical protein IFR41_00180 [Pseudomonas fluorescens]|nr:hypothetical protein [Pseudomonas fluorescens]TKK11250.1 hypothetical protein PflCFBP13514_05000 [Pseudomonas fluorescens]